MEPSIWILPVSNYILTVSPSNAHQPRTPSPAPQPHRACIYAPSKNKCFTFMHAHNHLFLWCRCLVGWHWHQYWHLPRVYLPCAVTETVKYENLTKKKKNLCVIVIKYGLIWRMEWLILYDGYRYWYKVLLSLGLLHTPHIVCILLLWIKKKKVNSHIKNLRVRPYVHNSNLITYLLRSYNCMFSCWKGRDIGFWLQCERHFGSNDNTKPKSDRFRMSIWIGINLCEKEYFW